MMFFFYQFMGIGILQGSRTNVFLIRRYKFRHWSGLQLQVPAGWKRILSYHGCTPFLYVCAVFRSQLPYCFGRNRGACKKRTQHQVFPTKPTLSSIEQVPEVVCSRPFQRENNKSRLTSNTKTWNESGVCMVDLICSVWSFQAMRN